MSTFCHPRANREVHFSDALVAYEFKRGQRRSIGFVVGPEGLVVHAPKWMALREVDAAVQEKSTWIVSKLRQSRERQQQQLLKQIEWRDGAQFPYLGAATRISLSGQPATAVKAAGLAALLAPSDTATAGQSLQLALPADASAENISLAVRGWLMRQARLLLPTRLDHFAPRLQVQWRKLALSNARTRWGSAHSDGSIRLNWRLLHFKPEVIDYVVVHELSHLRVMNHSVHFWNTVGSVLPDYAQLRAQLKDESTPRWE